MKKILLMRSEIIFFSILFCVVVFTACSNGVLSGADTFSVSGFVRDENDNPVADVTMYFSGNIERVQTDAEGFFSASGLSGEVVLTPVKNNYEFDSMTVSQTSEGILIRGHSVNVEYIYVSTVEELKATEMSTKEGNITVMIEEGIYHMTAHLFLTGNNLTYKSVSGNREDVVIDGGFNVGSLFMVAGKNFTLQDLSVGKVNNHAVQIHGEYDADNCHVKNVRFFDTREQMLKGTRGTDTSCDNGIVEDCLFEFTQGQAYQYYTGGIDVHQGKNWIVRDNRFRNICNPGGTLTEGAVHFWSDAEGTLIERNIIYNCDRGIMLGMDSSGHDHAIVRNNFVSTNRDVGIYLCNARNTLLYNNTVVINSAYPNAVEYRFDTTGSRIMNNLTNARILSRNDGVATVDHNILNAQDNWFIDVENGDLHLSQTILSVINAGVELQEITDDIDGEMRNLPDIGADEFQNVQQGDILSIELSVDRLQILANGLDTVNLTVIALYDDGTQNAILPDEFICTDETGKSYSCENSRFMTYHAGDYSIKATCGNFESNMVVITVENEELTDIQVSGLKLRHVDGQTFITWDEITQIMPGNGITYATFFDVLDNYTREIRYNIYRSDSKIENIEALTPIMTVDSLSCWNQAFYGMGNTRKKTEELAIRYIVEEGQPPLENGTGIYVSNPDENGDAWYAVTAIVDGVENKSVTSSNSSQLAIVETVGQGSPVLQRIVEDTAFQYINDADLHYYVRWEAPPNASVKGKPFDYLVAVPENVMNPAPVGLHLHCWGGSLEGGYGWWNDGMQGKILLSSNQYPYDWWTGYHEFLYTDREADDWQGGVVRPYSSTRLFSFLEWMNTSGRWQLDLSRTYTAGTSMGGSGTLMLAIRYPERISYARSWVGVHRPALSPNFKSSYSLVYGDQGENIKFEDGTPVWDYYDDVWYLQNNMNAEIGFLSFSNGKNDSAIGWQQAVDFVNCLQETRRPHLFIFGQGGHSQRTVLPGNNSEREMMIDVRTDQSLPAFTRCSLDDDPGNGDPLDGDSAGQINRWLYWETSDIVDSVNRWEMTVLLMDEASEDNCLTDITPRKVQRFKPAAGELLKWQNIDSETGEILESGDITVDQWGLFTVEQTVVSKGGNRLCIERK